MMKKHVMISIDEELHDKALMGSLNVSGIAENAIKKKLTMKEIEIKDICEFCGKKEIKASKKTNYIGLTWLCPDEKWICESCLNYKKRNVSISH